MIIGNQIFLRRLSEDDVSGEYVSWINNSQINQYLESRFSIQTIESVKCFVRSVTNDKNYLFGIFVNGTGQHIGNIKVGDINFIHKYANIGFIIGDKNYWGRGIATEAIKLATDFAFETLGLHKLYGGVYAPNIGSIKAFEKNGYEKEGVQRGHCLCDLKYVDVMLFGKINE